MLANVSIPAAESPTAAQPNHQALPVLTVSYSGRAYLNREAGRLLPAGLSSLRVSAPSAGIGARWWLLPEAPGGVPVHARADRLGYLRFQAPELAIHAFAIQPRTVRLVHFELRPALPFYLLYPLTPGAAAPELPA